RDSGDSIDRLSGDLDRRVRVSERSRGAHRARSVARQRAALRAHRDVHLRRRERATVFAYARRTALRSTPSAIAPVVIVAVVIFILESVERGDDVRPDARE